MGEFLCGAESLTKAQRRWFPRLGGDPERFETMPTWGGPSAGELPSPPPRAEAHLTL